MSVQSEKKFNIANCFTELKIKQNIIKSRFEKEDLFFPHLLEAEKMQVRFNFCAEKLVKVRNVIINKKIYDRLGYFG